MYSIPRFWNLTRGYINLYFRRSTKLSLTLKTYHLGGGGSSTAWLLVNGQTFLSIGDNDSDQKTATYIVNWTSLI